MNELFTGRSHIQALLRRAENIDATRKLTLAFQQLKAERVPFYLTLDELNEVLKWKLRGQHRRQLKRRENNTNANVIIITQAAFSVTHNNNEVETALRLRLLCALSGVEIPVASAILTLCFPQQYSVIDFRNWRQIYNTLAHKTTYTYKEYFEYLKIIQGLAKKYEVTPQEVDIAIWQTDIEKKQKLPTV